MVGAQPWFPHVPATLWWGNSISLSWTALAVRLGLSVTPSGFDTGGFFGLVALDFGEGLGGFDISFC